MIFIQSKAFLAIYFSDKYLSTVFLLLQLVSQDEHRCSCSYISCCAHDDIHLTQVDSKIQNAVIHTEKCSVADDVYYYAVFIMGPMIHGSGALLHGMIWSNNAMMTNQC